MQIDRNHILAACRALFAPTQVVEVSGLNCANRKVWGRQTPNLVGWFNNHEELAARVVQQDPAHPEGWYITPNALHEGMLTLCPNDIQLIHTVGGKRTSDRDVIRRHWFLVDVDPARPSGICSTDAELSVAQVVAEAVKAFLSSRGWPDPLVALSGNGYHLLYRIDFPRTDETNEIYRAALAVLAERWPASAKDDPQVCVASVDASTGNPSRLFRLYGTTCRKRSDNDRPQRLARILTDPIPAFDEHELVSLEQLQELAASKTPTATARSRGSSRRASQAVDVDLDAFIDRHQIAGKREDYQGGIRYLLDQCMIDPSHARPGVAALGKAATGTVWYRCYHNGCRAVTWKHIRAMYERDESRGRGKVKPTRQGDTPTELAEAILEELFVSELGEVHLRRHRETWYQYDSRRHVYAEIRDEEMDSAITRSLMERVDVVNRQKVCNVLGCLRAMVQVQGADRRDMPFWCEVDREKNSAFAREDSPNWIRLLNGILDIDKFIAGRPFAECLMAHTPNWLSTAILPYSFPTREEMEACPNWLAFLNEVLEGDHDRIQLLQELFGYCWCPDCRMEVFTILVGHGRNGKSVVLNVLEALLGPQCVSSLDLPQINSNMAGMLYGRLANICRDMKRTDSESEDILKRVSSGESLTVDRKFKSALEFAPVAKVWFAANKIPNFRDTTGGIWRRLIAIPFNYIVPLSKRDPKLFEKRLRPELSGIFIWALRGLARLLAVGEFTRAAACEAEAREFKNRCFPILAFLEDTVMPGGVVGQEELYGLYRNWCTTGGLTRPKPRGTFLTDIQDLWPDVEFDVSTIGNEPVIRGMQKKP